MIDNNYLAPLWETGAGKVGLIVGIIMVMLGSYSIKRIVDIKV
jgi:Flp pilus assembly protein TadB